MAVSHILFNPSTPFRLRMLALVNILAFSFLIVMTVLTTAIAYFVIVPALWSHDEQKALMNRCAIGYLFVNMCGNILLCMSVDSSYESNLKKTLVQTKNKSSNAGILTRKNGVSLSNQSDSSPTTLSSKTVMSSPEKVVLLSKTIVSAPKTVVSSDCTSLHETMLPDTTYPEPILPKIILPDTIPSETIVQETILPKIINPKTNLSETILPKSINPQNIISETNLPDPILPEPNPSPASSNLPCESQAPHPHRLSQGPECPELAERCHPCKLCQSVILRRDHHCFFLMTCVGYRNHKHFLFFNLYMALGALYGLTLTARFLHVKYGIEFQGPQTLVMLAARWVQLIVVKRVVPSQTLALLFLQLYVFLLVFLASACFLIWHLRITCAGQTTREATRGDRRYDQGLTANLNDVMGPWWPLLFLLPLPLSQATDGRHYKAAALRLSQSQTKTFPPADRGLEGEVRKRKAGVTGKRGKGRKR